MAKWGSESMDERWKVEDLGEAGQNVGGWHWVEKDAMEWSTARLNELLGGVHLSPPNSEITIKTAGLSSVNGEAVVNNRKKKVIAAYELSIVVDWTATDAAGSAVATGQLRLPYVSEENHDEDPEIQVVTTTEDAVSQSSKGVILNYGRQVVAEGIAVFVKELQAGGPMMKKGAQMPAPSAKVKNGGERGEQKQTDTKEVAVPNSSGHSIKLVEKFYASAKDIFECLTDARRIMAFSQSAAESDPTPGGRLLMFGSAIEGVYRQVSPPHELSIDWRFSNWEEGVYSKVVISIEEPDKGNVIVHLNQSGIPDADRFGNHDVASVAESGWREQVFGRIRKVFGYGA